MFENLKWYCEKNFSVGYIDDDETKIIERVGNIGVHHE